MKKECLKEGTYIEAIIQYVVHSSKKIEVTKSISQCDLRELYVMLRKTGMCSKSSKFKRTCFD